MKKSIGKFDKEDLYLTIANYRNNGRIYLAVENADEELYADITINLVDMLLPGDDYVFVNNDMTKELRNFLEEKNIIGETLYSNPYNMGQYDMVKVDFDLLKEYDPDGFEKYEDYKNHNDDYEL